MKKSPSRKSRFQLKLQGTHHLNVGSCIWQLSMAESKAHSSSESVPASPEMWAASLLHLSASHFQHLEDGLEELNIAGFGLVPPDQRQTACILREILCVYWAIAHKKVFEHFADATLADLFNFRVVSTLGELARHAEIPLTSDHLTEAWRLYSGYPPNSPTVDEVLKDYGDYVYEAQVRQHADNLLLDILSARIGRCRGVTARNPILSMLFILNGKLLMSTVDFFQAVQPQFELEKEEGHRKAE